jgi:uncharacterized protein YyaL (SSP411 family)
MDTILWDPARRLYRWSVSYQDLARRTGVVIDPRNFNYDQGIAIQAQLLAAAVDGDSARLPRAELLGRAIQDTFWLPGHGYRLASGSGQVYTSYSAWTSLGHLALYDASGDPMWREWAQANLDAMTGDVGEADGGFGLQAFSVRWRAGAILPPG